MRYWSSDGIDAEAGAAKNTDSAQSRRARRARISRPKKDDAAEDEREKFDDLEPEYSHLYLAASGRLAGVICIADPLRPEAARVLRALRGLGITNTVMMTDDSERTAAAIAKQVGVDRFFAEVLPEVETRTLPVMAVWPPVAPVPAKLRVLIDHLAVAFSGGAPWQ